MNGFKCLSDGHTGAIRMREMSLSLSSFSSTDTHPGPCFKQQHRGGKSPGPHRHKHTTDWTNDTLPQRISSSAEWPRVIGLNCLRPLKGWTTMGSLCEDTDRFTSSSPGLLTLLFFEFSTLMRRRRSAAHRTQLENTQNLRS